MDPWEGKWSIFLLIKEVELNITYFIVKFKTIILHMVCKQGCGERDFDQFSEL